MSGRIGWEPLRLAFIERQQGRESRETLACVEIREVVLNCLSNSDLKALDFLVGEHPRPVSGQQAAIPKAIVRQVGEM